MDHPIDVAVRVPESGDDDPGLGVDEDNLLVVGGVESCVEQGPIDVGAVSDGVNLVAGADHPVEVSELLLLLLSLLLMWLLMLMLLLLLMMLLLLGIGRPWRAGDDASVVHDEHRHFMDYPIVFKLKILITQIKTITHLNFESKSLWITPIFREA